MTRLPNKLRNRFPDSKPTTLSGAFLLTIIIFIAMRVSNEVASNLSTYIQSSVVKEFFLTPSNTYEAALARFTMLSFLISGVALVAPFYKSLADVWGRKTLLTINMAGLCVGMILCFFSHSVLMYFCGAACIVFFVQNDLQMVYFLETAPPGKGAQYFGLIKSFGILGLILIPTLRSTFMANDPTRWRSIFLLPVFFCLIVAVLMSVFLKESKIYAGPQIDTNENLIAQQSVKNQSQKTTGVKSAIQYVLAQKELRWFVVAYMLYSICSLSAYSYVESIMTTNGISAADITKALFVYPFIYAGISFLSGFIADKYGRKPVILLTSLLFVVGFPLFIMGCKYQWNPYLLGLINGLYLGGFWMCGDYMNISLLEKTPTKIRASVTGGVSILMMGGVLVGLAIQLTLMVVLSNVGIACLLLILPCIIACVIIILTKVKETKGTLLDQVTN